MSVMIKGMEMPESCGKCKMHFIGHSNYVCCGITDRIPKIVDSFHNSKIDLDTRIKSIEAVKRPYWCQLVEIPTPHGRLIDADEIINKIDEIEVEGGILATAINCVGLLVENAPTIIEAEMDNTKSDEKYLQKLMQEIFSKTLILESTTGELHEVIHIDDLKDIFREVMGWTI